MALFPSIPSIWSTGHAWSSYTRPDPGFCDPAKVWFLFICSPPAGVLNLPPFLFPCTLQTPIEAGEWGGGGGGDSTSVTPQKEGRDPTNRSCVDGYTRMPVAAKSAHEANDGERSVARLEKMVDFASSIACHDKFFASIHQWKYHAFVSQVTNVNNVVDLSGWLFHTN